MERAFIIKLLRILIISNLYQDFNGEYGGKEIVKVVENHVSIWLGLERVFSWNKISQVLNIFEALNYLNRDRAPNYRLISIGSAILASISKIPILLTWITF